LNEIQTILSNIKQKKPVDVGDVVYGKIIAVKEKMIIIALDYAEDNKVLSPADSGIVFIRNVSRDYVKNIDDFFKKGDVVKAKIIEITPFEYKLTTAEDNLGVIKGHCTQCKQELKNNGTAQIRCFNCGKIQTKKFVIGD